jgi:hypothetical protein
MSPSDFVGPTAAIAVAVALYLASLAAFCWIESNCRRLGIDSVTKAASGFVTSIGIGLSVYVFYGEFRESTAAEFSVSCSKSAVPRLRVETNSRGPMLACSVILEPRFFDQTGRPIMANSVTIPVSCDPQKAFDQPIVPLLQSAELATPVSEDLRQISVRVVATTARGSQRGDAVAKTIQCLD